MPPFPVTSWARLWPVFPAHFHSLDAAWAVALMIAGCVIAILPLLLLSFAGCLLPMVTIFLARFRVVMVMLFFPIVEEFAFRLFLFFWFFRGIEPGIGLLAAFYWEVGAFVLCHIPVAIVELDWRRLVDALVLGVINTAMLGYMVLCMNYEVLQVILGLIVIHMLYNGAVLLCKAFPVAGVLPLAIIRGLALLAAFACWWQGLNELGKVWAW
jgi:hypothetical protein